MADITVQNKLSANIGKVASMSATLSCPKSLSGDVTMASGTVVTRDYEKLINHPRINSVELLGNKTSTDLGLQDELDYADFTDIDDMFYGI